MPEFSNADRCMIETECRLWTINQMLIDSDGDCGAWDDRIREVRKTIKKLAEELRDYNDQFEVNEE